jgi:hypothetical protein
LAVLVTNAGPITATLAKTAAARQPGSAGVAAAVDTVATDAAELIGRAGGGEAVEAGIVHGGPSGDGVA